jgi:fucose permease
MNPKTKIFSFAAVYLLYVGIGGGALGIIVVPITNTFNITPAKIAVSYTILSIGSMVMLIATTSIILSIISIRKAIGIQLLLALASSLSIVFFQNITAGKIAFCIYGGSIGMAWALGNYFILSIYDGKEKNSKTSLLSAFYNFGAIFISMFGGYLIGEFNISWKLILTFGSYLLVINFIYSFFVDYSIIRKEKKEDSSKEKKFIQQARQWPVSVWLLALSIFFCVVSFLSFSTWIVPYAEKHIGVTSTYAAFISSVFWLISGCSRLYISYLMKKWTVERYLLIGTSITAIFIFLFASASNLLTEKSLLISTCLLAIGYAALVPMLYSFGSLQVKKTTRMLISLYFTVGGIASIAGPIILTLVLNLFDNNLACTMYFCGITMTISFTLIFITTIVYKSKTKLENDKNIKKKI